jgi:hypothetical protein
MAAKEFGLGPGRFIRAVTMIGALLCVELHVQLLIWGMSRLRRLLTLPRHG